MKKFLSILFLLVLCPILSAQNSTSEQLDRMIQDGIRDWKVPGLAVVVVKDGEIAFKETYGIRNVEKPEKVDGNTLFNMASTTKAMVAMAMGILVDQGKLNWDDKVVSHLPSFKLSDPYITADARIKDLFTHNLGIGNADYLWAIDSVSTAETLRRFSKAERKYPLRGGFVYQNIMYAVAGKVIEAVSGMDWTQFIEENLFEPLEMNRTQAKSADILKVGNYANPHYEDFKGKAYRVHHKFSDQIGPAGMIWSSIDDISNYLKFLTNDGVYKNKTIIQPNTFKFLFEPQVILTENARYPTITLTKPKFNTYAMGWFQKDYRGKKLNFHTGSLFGMIAIAGVIQEDDFAVYVFGNMDHAELRHAILFNSIDLFLFNDNSRDWNQEILDLYSGPREGQKKYYQKLEESRIKNTNPTLALKDYTGKYYNENLGELQISLNNNSLQYKLNNVSSGPLGHYHYDTFIIKGFGGYENRMLLTFQLDEWGKVAEVKVLGETFNKK